jgi:hypothetical protein
MHGNLNDSKKRKIKTTDGKKNVIIGGSWYRAFMQRHEDSIRVGRCNVKDNNRRTWCTVEHFTEMYDGVYDSMVTAGIAEKLDEDRMYDINGIETDNVEEMFGRPTKFRMLHPENLLFVDETGCNTNMKTDKLIGGERHILPVGDKEDAGVTGATTDNHFTVLCFTNGLGVPVLCAIILKSSKHIKDIPLNWKMGIDITKRIVNADDEDEMVRLNSGNDKAMRGGPVCTYKGQEIPCFVGCSPSASITSELLVAMLETIDKHNVMDRTNAKQPVLLLDGHHSRFELPNKKEYNVNHSFICSSGNNP